MLPDLTDATDSVRTVSQKAVSTLPWLSDPFTCPECNVPCEESAAYDPIEGAFYEWIGGERPTYQCPRCETHYRREETSKHSFEIW